MYGESVEKLEQRKTRMRNDNRDYRLAEQSSTNSLKMAQVPSWDFINSSSVENSGRAKSSKKRSSLEKFIGPIYENLRIRERPRTRGNEVSGLSFVQLQFDQPEHTAAKKQTTESDFLNTPKYKNKKAPKTISSANELPPLYGNLKIAENAFKAADSDQSDSRAIAASDSQRSSKKARKAGIRLLSAVMIRANLGVVLWQEILFCWNE
ncbi:unnamed protein product [Gongylonema pulchrum]|uniref:Uncharacterized protein n=1 Tax=Gongylonema pulchrum TaxID=637853 RepID=A0A183E377_9BILA|nr:unnamed protein product [Gongylonema pulchrum]